MATNPPLPCSPQSSAIVALDIDLYSRQLRVRPGRRAPHERRALSGVQVRLLIAGSGAMQLPHSFVKHLKVRGIQTPSSLPFRAQAHALATCASPQNGHRRGRTCGLGAESRPAEYFYVLKGAKPWRDLSFDCKDPSLPPPLVNSEADWARSGTPAAPRRRDVEHSRIGRRRDRAQYAGGRAQFLPSGPDQRHEYRARAAIDRVSMLAERLLVVTPYFVPIPPGNGDRLAAPAAVRNLLGIPAVRNHRLADFARKPGLAPRHGRRPHSFAAIHDHRSLVFYESLAISGSSILDSPPLLTMKARWFLWSARDRLACPIGFEP